MAVKELSLRPYTGRLFLAKTAAEYERGHVKLFKTPDVLTCATDGRFSGGEGQDGIWTYLVWAEAPHTLAHELSHVVLHVFERCGIDPREGGGEPFCYMLGQLILDAAYEARQAACPVLTPKQRGEAIRHGKHGKNGRLAGDDE